MTEPLTPPDPKPNSDQTVCENCECMVDELSITETINGDTGCTECISNCRWCGNPHFNDDMFDCPYFGKTCQPCLNGEEYQKALRQEILKNALRCYFDQTPSRQIERLIIDAVRSEGFTELAHEMKNDL